MMVMKRSSDSDNFAKSKRVRPRTDLDDNGVRERLSSPESARDNSPNRRSSSLSRKPDDRTYKRSNMNMRNDNGYQTQPRKRVDREREPQIRISNIASHIADSVVKEELFHEFKKCGGVFANLFGRGDERYAVMYFRNAEDIAELKRNVDRRGRPVLFDRQLRLEYNFYNDRASRRDTPDYGSTNRETNHRSLSPPRRNRGNSNFHIDQEQRINRGEQNDRRNRSGGPFNQSPREPYISPEDDPKATRTLFVGNLETIVSSLELRRAFERFGVVEDVDIKRPARGQGNTYAFVKFSDLDVAAKAKVEMQGEIIGRNRVKIGYGKSQQTTRLWVGGLGPWTSVSDLEREFDRFGAIRRIDYKKGDDHAYILYDSLDAASVAAREMRGFCLNDRRLKIDFADKEQGLREYQEQLPRALSPPRNRVNNFKRFEDRFQPRQNNHDYNDDRVFPERKREPSPFRRNAREDNNFQEWRGGDNMYRRPEFDRPVEDIRTGPRQYLEENWQHRGDLSGPPDQESEDWDRRETRTTRERKYRIHGPQTPPVDEYRSFEPSPENDFTDRTRKRKARSPYVDYRNEQSPIKRHRSPRTRSLSPDRPNHVDHAVRSSNRSRQSSPTFRRQSGSSSDGQVHSVVDGYDKEPRTGDMQFKEKSYPSERNIVTDTPAKKAVIAISPATSSVSDTLQDLAKRFAIAWKGAFVLKNSAFPVRMHLVGGNPEVADSLLRNDSTGPASPNSLLRITQRLRLDQPKLEEVSRRMSTAGASGHCLLLAMPGGQSQLAEDMDGEEPLQQRPLRNLMHYLKQKQAAGVVNLPAIPTNPAVAKDDIGVLHAFPPCQFSHEHLMRIAPHLSSEPSKEDHLVIIVVRGSG